MELVLQLDSHVVTFPKPVDADRGEQTLRLAEAIRAVADGDRDAFSQLYAAYVRMVHAILLGRVPRLILDERQNQQLRAALLQLAIEDARFDILHSDILAKGI